MNRFLIREELRKVWWWYTPLLLLLLTYLLAQIAPLRHFDGIVPWMSAIQGALLGLSLFSDGDGVQSFMFSRPITRRNLFLTRWAVGMTVQCLTILAVLVLLAGGIRSALHVRLGGFYHPMVRWYELEILWSVILPSFFSYHLTMLFKVYVETVWPPVRSIMHGMRRATALFVAGGGLTLLLLDRFNWHILWWLHVGQMYGLVGEAFAVMLLAVVCGDYGYRKMEVAS